MHYYHIAFRIIIQNSTMASVLSMIKLYGKDFAREPVILNLMLRD